jgi:hypothetical protein
MQKKSHTTSHRLIVCHGRVGRAFRAGFTFTEVMFAVILLGIGFIMLAGMFPVAIQQTQTNMEESTGSTLVQAATRYLEQTLTNADLPPTGNLNPPTGFPIVYPRFLRMSETCNPANGVIGDDFFLWEKVRGGFILPQDPRFAWTALYKRNPGDNFAQVILFACQARNYPNYGPLDLERAPVGSPTAPYLFAPLEPRFLPAFLSDGGEPGIPDIITFTPPPPTQPDCRPALEEGCFVVVSDDGVSTDEGATPYFDPGYANGRIYRVGNRRADLDPIHGGLAYELMPGHDMQSPEENLPLRQPPHGPTGPQGYRDHQGNIPATVFIVGKGFTSPRDGDYSVTGFAQDIAVYTTFIRLK